MKQVNAVKMNKMAAMVYGLSVWTLVGWLALRHFTGSNKDEPTTSAKKDLEDDPLVEVYKTQHFKSVIVRQQESVRLSTQLANFLEPWFGGRDK